MTTDSSPSNRDTRRRFEQWASNPKCAANTVSAVHNIKMAEVAKKIGIKPTFGASPFALGHGEQFERVLLDNDAERLRREFLRARLVTDRQTGFLDLRITSNGGSDRSLRDLDDAIARSLDFLVDAGRAKGEEVYELPPIVAALTVRIPRGVMLPEALLIIDAVTVTPVEIAGCTHAQLTVGEIKTYPDRGGETNRGQLAQARAQMGLYLHALTVVTEGLPDDARPALNEEGFLVMTRPGSNFPSVRTGERLRYQAERAARGFDQLELIAQSLPPVKHHAIDAVLEAETSYCEACLEFCDLAERCHAQASLTEDPVILGDTMARLLGGIDLKRALELLEGAPPLDTRERELAERLRAAEEPGWE